MTRPRQIVPNQFYMLNRRCTQRMFLLRPDAETNNAFIYCLGVAAQRHGIDVILPVAEANHHHTTIYDRHGREPEFTQLFHKLVSSCMNAYRGRWENFWSSEPPCTVRLIGRETVIAKLIYTASNPVKDHLVTRVHLWPGVNGYTNLVRGRVLHATRPRHFFSEDGDLPESVTLQLTIPPELGPAQEVIDAVREGVEAIEAALASEIRRGETRVLGRRAVREQSWRARPRSKEPRRNLRPRFAAVNPDARINALRTYRAFLGAYRDARDSWLSGEAALFPHGTYWLRRFANVSTAPPDEPN
jgi:putative transposase